MMFKSLLAVALVAVSMHAVYATEVSLDVEVKSETTGDKPKGASFACKIESRRCKSVEHYTDVVYDHHLEVTKCYQPHTLKNLYNRFTPFGNRGLFADTVYVSCPTKPNKDDKAVPCDLASSFATMHVQDIRQIVVDGINEQTRCSPRVECFKLQDVDAQCFPL